MKKNSGRCKGQFSTVRQQARAARAWPVAMAASRAGISGRASKAGARWVEKRLRRPSSVRLPRISGSNRPSRRTSQSGSSKRGQAAGGEGCGQGAGEIEEGQGLGDGNEALAACLGAVMAARWSAATSRTSTMDRSSRGAAGSGAVEQALNQNGRGAGIVVEQGAEHDAGVDDGKVVVAAGCVHQRPGQAFGPGLALGIGIGRGAVGIGPVGFGERLVVSAWPYWMAAIEEVRTIRSTRRRAPW